jgi:hypothetical protein
MQCLCMCGCVGALMMLSKEGQLASVQERGLGGLAWRSWWRRWRWVGLGVCSYCSRFVVWYTSAPGLSDSSVLSFSQTASGKYLTAEVTY